jgi:transposase
MEKNNPNLIVSYFTEYSNTMQKQYLALRRFFIDKHTAEQVAKEFNYSVMTIYSLVRDFKIKLAESEEDPFFKEPVLGRKKIDPEGEVRDLVVNFRKKYFSVPEIKTALDALGFSISERTISTILTNEGFARLPRRSDEFRNEIEISNQTVPLTAPRSKRLSFGAEKFTSQQAGLLCFLPLIKRYGIDKAIQASSYPKTKEIGRLSSILCFLALKLSNVERYSMDDMWCMDRGLGLFAGLNVLPKTAWFSSYSSGITREMNIEFLKNLNVIWGENGLHSDTMNLDFTAIPYWGDDDTFENNWSGKRGKALASLQAVLAQDSDTGIICYGDTTIRHDGEKDVILEFLDFYGDDKARSNLKYLIFDSKFTTYQNLSNLNKRGMKFVTIQRRSQKLEGKIKAVPNSSWKTVRIEQANGKGRNIIVCEEKTKLTNYDGEVRQIFIKGNGKIKPAIIISNDFTSPLKELVRKYSRRWLVEKGISEQIYFFHLNKNSSGIVVKVDFDLTMTILAHNFYKLLAKDIDGYSHCEAKTIYNKFIDNAGEIEITDSVISVSLKKKRSLPLILEMLNEFDVFNYSWLNNLNLSFISANFT